MKSAVIFYATLLLLALYAIIRLGLDINQVVNRPGDLTQIPFFVPLALGFIVTICVVTKRYLDREDADPANVRRINIC
ncbi:MAG: hypothetical protein WCW31_03415 [Patescibacteria group bacterium]